MIQSTQPTAARPVKWCCAAAAFLITLLLTAGCSRPHVSPAATGDTGNTGAAPAEVITTLGDAQPTSVAISPAGRLFLSFFAPVYTQSDRDDGLAPPLPAIAEHTAEGEIKTLIEPAWPRWDGKRDHTTLRRFVRITALRIDRDNQLWALDAGSPRPGQSIVPGGAKLVVIDLDDNTVAAVHYLDEKHDLPKGADLTDLALDADGRHVYLADAGAEAIHTLNTETGELHVALAAVDALRPEPNTTPIVGGRPWQDLWGRTPQQGVTSLAATPDGQWLYFQALTARTLYRVPLAELRNPQTPVHEREESVEQAGSFGSAVTALRSDHAGQIFATAIEKDAVMVRRLDGRCETAVADAKLVWPESLSLDPHFHMVIATSARHLRRPYRFADREDAKARVLGAPVDVTPIAEDAAVWVERDADRE